MLRFKMFFSCCLLVVSLCFASHSAPLEDFSLDQTRAEVIEIYRSRSRSFEDRETFWQEKLTQITSRSVTNQDIETLYQLYTMLIAETGSMFSIPEQREKLVGLFNDNITTTQRNRETCHNTLCMLEGSTVEDLKRHFSALLSQQRSILDTRKKDDGIPSTIPGLMKALSPSRREIAEKARMNRADEAYIMKILSQAFSSEEIDEQFKQWEDLYAMKGLSKSLAQIQREFPQSPSVEDDMVFSSYFLVLKAYILGLVETPPLPDHFVLSIQQESVRRAEKNKKFLLDSYRSKKISLTYFRTLTQKENSTLEQSNALLNGLLRDLQELETRSIQALEQLKILRSQPPQASEEGALREEPAAPKKKKKKKKKSSSHAATSADAASPAMLHIPADEEEEGNLDDVAPSFSLLSSEPSLGPLQPGPGPSAPLASNTPENFDLSSPAEDAAAAEADPDEEAEAAEPAEEAAEAAEPAEEAAEAAEAANLMPWKQYSKSTPPTLASDVKEEPNKPTLPPRTFDLWTAFYTQPELKWSEFTSLFTKIGIGITPKGGSIHQLTYGSRPSHTGRDHIVVHKPHGAFDTLGPKALSHLRRALNEDFGWTQDSFAYKKN